MSGTARPAASTSPPNLCGPRLRAVKVGTGHAYRLDCACPGPYRKIDPHRVPGVTTALGVLSKDGLTGWAGRETAAYAVDHWDRLAKLPPSERLRELEKAHDKARRGAAMKGTKLHEVAEKLVRGEDVYVPDEARPEAEMLARWLDREQYTGWGGEVACVSIEHRYAGTLDNAGILGRRGERVLVDFKRTNKIYEENVSQLAAYRFTDLWYPDGPQSEEATPEFDATYVVHITPDGVELVPVEADRQCWTEFLYVLQVYRDRWTYGDQSRIGAPLAPLEEDEDGQ